MKQYLLRFKSFNVFYFFLLLFNILFLYRYTAYFIVSKPLIMSSLVAFYISNVSKQNHALLLAMIFALFGDIFLLSENSTFFILGLGSFLIMQILYASIMYKYRGQNKTWQINVAFGLAAIAIGCIYFLWSNLGAYKLPVIIYMCAIITMAYFGLTIKESKVGYLSIACGVVLFIISDFVLAINKFSFPIQHASLIIMVTYIIAQYGIIRGMVDLATLHE